jgi:hypothetical protein
MKVLSMCPQPHCPWTLQNHHNVEEVDHQNMLLSFRSLSCRGVLPGGKQIHHCVPTTQSQWREWLLPKRLRVCEQAGGCWEQTYANRVSEQRCREERWYTGGGCGPGVGTPSLAWFFCLLAGRAESLSEAIGGLTWAIASTILFFLPSCSTPHAWLNGFVPNCPSSVQQNRSLQFFWQETWYDL